MAQAPATVTAEINGLYVAMYGLPATQAGINYWVGVLSAFDKNVTAANAALTPIVPADQLYIGLQMTSNSPQVGGTSYFATLYPASMTDTAFVEALYKNMSNFQGTAAGIQYWFNQLQALETTGGLSVIAARESIAGTFVYAFISNDLTVGAAALGVSASDYANLVAGQQALLNKISVSEFLANTTANNPTSVVNYTSTTSAAFAADMGLIATVNANPVSATNADTAITAADTTKSLTPITTLASVPSGTTFTLTTGVDVINSASSGDVVIGTLTGTASTTLNPGDSIAMNGGTLKVVDTVGSGTNELAGILVTGPFVFQVQEVTNAGTYDFGALATVTKVISSNSAFGTTFTTLPTGTVVEASGAASTAGTIVSFKYASTSAAVALQFDSGVNGVAIQDTAGTGAATTATISSTGLANGTATNFDKVGITQAWGFGNGTVTSETINAATNLNASFSDADWKGFGAANTDTFTIQGAAASVNVNFGNYVVGANTVNASGLTAGGLTATFNGFVTSFTGGAGNDLVFLDATPLATGNYNFGAGNNSFLETGGFGPLPAGFVANGGSATATNVISAQFLSAGDAANITNFQLMDLGWAIGTTYDAALYAGSAFTGVTYTSGTGGVGTAQPSTAAPTVTDLVGTAETLSVTGTTTAGFFEGNTISISQANASTATAATGDTMAISFANNANAGSTTSWATLVTSHLVSETINAGTTVTSGPGTELDQIAQLQDKANLLTTVTITGTANFTMGANAVSTDTGAANPASATNVASSLTLIDGSGLKGNLTIEAGANINNPGGSNGNLTVTYTGLTIKGGSGLDSIQNDAASGVVVLGNGGTSLGAGNFTGAIATNTGETVTFGTGFDKASFQTPATGSSFDTGTINGTLAANHDLVAPVSQAITAVTDVSTAATVTGATSLLNAEVAASVLATAHQAAYFTWVDGNEYIVANAGSTGAVNTNIAIELVGGAFHHITEAGGVLTLA